MQQKQNLSSFYHETAERYREVSHSLEASHLPLLEQEKLEKKQKALLTKLLYLQKQAEMRRAVPQNTAVKKEKMQIPGKGTKQLGFFGVLFEMLQKIGLIKETPQTPKERKPLIHSLIKEVPSLRAAQKQKRQRLLAVRQAYFQEKRASMAHLATHSKENLQQVLLRAAQQRRALQRAA